MSKDGESPATRTKTIADEARRQARWYLIFSPFVVIWALTSNKPDLAVMFVIWAIAAPLMIRRKRAGVVLFFIPFIHAFSLLTWQTFVEGPEFWRIGLALGILVVGAAHAYSFIPLLLGRADWDDPDPMDSR